MAHTPDSVASSRLRFRLFTLSVVALFVELALIRYVASEVRIFAYFKNLVLIACFFGFGLGFFRSARAARLDLSLGAVVLVVTSIWVGASMGDVGLSAPSVAFSNFVDSLTMGEEGLSTDNAASVYQAGVLWTLLLFASCIAAMFGYAQAIGHDIDSFGRGRQIEAYSWNVAGSLGGILLFGLCSRLALAPVYWFVPAVLATLPFLQSRLQLALGALGLLLCSVALSSGDGSIWSPYQKLQYADNPGRITVNGTGYMSLRSMAGEREAGKTDRWRHAYELRPDARSVLIVGAGGGNDVAAALASGVPRVVAVEIDPEIYALGREHHPDAPYADPRVHLYVDDARHFGEVTDERFDLIVFSHLDSHTSLSGFTNVRLDNYIYTAESFQTFRKLLNPSGAMYVTFWATRPWLAPRLGANMQQAFDGPILHRYSDRSIRGRRVTEIELFATEDPALRAAVLSRGTLLELPADATAIPSTDDWPYLFAKERAVPMATLLLSAILGVLSLVVIGGVVAREMRRGQGLLIDRHFFFLGAAFLLVEVHNVGKLARVFGTTWSVNAWVITGVLTMILAANVAVSRFPGLQRPGPIYPLLLGSLLLAWYLPIDLLLDLPLAALIVSGFYTLPLFFAGLIFAGSFMRAASPARALGSNILGSLLGGFLEVLSFRFGVSGLLLVAAALYAASFPGPWGAAKAPTATKAPVT